MATDPRPPVGPGAGAARHHPDADAASRGNTHADAYPDADGSSHYSNSDIGRHGYPYARNAAYANAIADGCPYRYGYSCRLPSRRHALRLDVQLQSASLDVPDLHYDDLYEHRLDDHREAEKLN